MAIDTEALEEELKQIRNTPTEKEDKDVYV